MRYNLKDIRDKLKTGMMVRSNGDSDGCLWGDDYVEGVLYVVLHDLYIFSNDINYDGNGTYILSNSEFADSYKYSWIIHKGNSKCWIEIEGMDTSKVNPIKLILKNI